MTPVFLLLFVTLALAYVPIAEAATQHDPCVLDFEPSRPEEDREVKAAKIKECLEDTGGVWATDAFILGPINIGGNLAVDRCESDAPRVFVAGNVKFDNTTFRGEVCISNVTFEGEVTFRFAKFEKRLFFESVDFAEEVNFYDADVAGKVRFIRVNFDKVVTFDKAPFRGEMRFGRETEMSGVTFKGDATFNKTRFGSKTEMFGVTFEGDAIFDKAQFGGVTEMSDVEFVESSAFTSVTFKGPTGLLNSRFSTNRSATTTFAKAKFEANSSFEGSTFFGWRTSLADATFERSVHPPARAEGQLDLKWGQVHRTVPTLGRAETMNDERLGEFLHHCGAGFRSQESPKRSPAR